jgi:hydrogenase/urease accessory protein HupE
MAHGIEIPVEASALAFAAGFSLACGLAISASYIVIKFVSQRFRVYQKSY